MEGRRPGPLQLEMTDLSAAEYRRRRAQWSAGRDPHLFTNCRRDRDDLPRTIPDFDLLAVWSLASDTPAPPSDEDITGSFRFEPTERPGQGSLAGEPTLGLELVLISPRDPDAHQDLRDWGDFVHIRHIAEAAVPHFGMITPYRNAGPGPVFLHLYELHTTDAESAFQAMTPAVAARMGGTDTDAYRQWARHPQLQIDYVNTFSRLV